MRNGFAKACLIGGVDDISFTAQYLAQIDAFVERYRGEHPWLALSHDKHA